MKKIDYIIILLVIVIILLIGIFAFIPHNNSNSSLNLTNNNTTTNNTFNTTSSSGAVKNSPTSSEITNAENGGHYYKGQYFPPSYSINQIKSAYNDRYNHAHSVPQGHKDSESNMYWDQNDGYDGHYATADDYYNRYGYLPN